MYWIFSNDTFMTWLLYGSVFFMFFALGWRETGKGKRPPPLKGACKKAPWTVSRLLVTGIIGLFAGLIAFPPALCAALVRTAISYKRQRQEKTHP
jgi:hypothetical protein